MKSDEILQIGNSLLQHGYYNNRIYLMKIDPKDTDTVIKQIASIQNTFHYKKIILKIPRFLEKFFQTPDSVTEAVIPDFYQGTADALFLSRFFHPEQLNRNERDRIQKNIFSLQKKKNSVPDNRKSENIVIREGDYPDIPEICALYQREFKTYPFPIHEPLYLQKIMDGGTRIFIGSSDSGIVAAGSCETDSYSSSVEMSDLAIDPQFRGQGISKQLLFYMEQCMKKAKLKTAYTICRSKPIPVNRLFSGAQYRYGGTLLENTNICGNFESMNVWYKPLS
ncbi:MAG: putative beta-lysine N-acetyltransferase [Methanospirillaceae archaeon]|nr:putative beta-lysine N-acetyltransferase [Methanospirillaceae archaeon]